MSNDEDPPKKKYIPPHLRAHSQDITTDKLPPKKKEKEKKSKRRHSEAQKPKWNDHQQKGQQKALDLSDLDEQNWRQLSGTRPKVLRAKYGKSKETEDPCCALELFHLQSRIHGHGN